MAVTSSNIKVREFIDGIKMSDHSKYMILEKLREIVFKLYPAVKERMMYGGIILSLDEDWGGLFVYKNHVSFEFSLGFKLKDPDNFLEGGGKYRRHLKFRSKDEIELKKVAYYLKQISDIH